MSSQCALRTIDRLSMLRTLAVPGNPEYGCELHPVNFSVVAEGFGVRAFRVEDPEQCKEMLRAALEHPGPALVDAVVNTNEPMLPPKRRETYVENLSKALEKGRPQRSEIERSLAEEPASTSLRH